MSSSLPSAGAQITVFDLLPAAYIAVPLILVILSLIATVLRVYVRFFLLKSGGWDDALLILAFLVFAGNSSIFIAMGAIEHRQGLVAPLETLAWLQLIGMLVYLPNQILLKLSVALFMLRIVTGKTEKMLIYVVTAIYVVYEFATLMLDIFQCGTPSLQLVTGSECLSWSVYGTVNYLAGALNAVTDWIFVLIPIVTISRSNMMRAHVRRSATVLIGLGALGSVASVARIDLLKVLKVENTLFVFADFIPLVLVSLTETALGIIAISLATLRPLLDRMHGIRSTDRSSIHTHHSSIQAARTYSVQMESRKNGPTTALEAEILDSSSDKQSGEHSMSDVQPLAQRHPAANRMSWTNNRFMAAGDCVTEISATGDKR